MAKINRRDSVAVNIGGVRVGGCNAVVVQSMTNTDTADAAATAQQCVELARAGSELVRVTVNNKAAAAAVPEIVSRMRDAGVNTPIIGDFHYNGHILLTEFPDCARALAKYRINPGNVGAGKHHDNNFKAMIDVANDNAKPVRIGVNWGSLDQALLARLMDDNAKLAAPLDAKDVMKEAIVRSAIESAELAESYGMPRERILLSAKCSDVQDLIDVYRELARRGPYALHLGLTEAGMGAKGIVASTAALAVLLVAASVTATVLLMRRGEPGKDLAGQNPKQTATPQTGVTPNSAPSPTTELANAGQEKSVKPAVTNPPSTVRREPPQKLSEQELLVRQMARAEREYQGAIKMLDQAIAKRRDYIEPEAFKQYQNSLALIDNSIAQSKRALREQPNDLAAGQFLLAAYAKKVELMQTIAMN